MKKIKILHTYILKEFLHPFFYSIFSFILIFIVVEILQRIRTFHDNNVLVMDIVKFYFYKTPSIVLQILPLATILATFFSLSSLVKNNELIALRNSGIHTLKIFSSLFVFSIFLGVCVFFFNETTLPYTNFMAEKINNERIRKIVLAVNDIQTNMAYKGHEGELLFAEKFVISSKILDKVTLFIFNKKNELTKMILANQVHYENNRWIISDGYIRIFNNGAIMKELKIEKDFLPFSSEPQDLTLGERSPSAFSFWELKDHINKLKESGREYSTYLTDLYAKTSTPFSCLVIIIFGIPLALKSQSGSKTLEFGLSLLTSFIFWGVNHLFFSLGKNEILSPFFSAWLGNIAFLVIGGYLIYQKE